jgi:hypothetical protein
MAESPIEFDNNKLCQIAVVDCRHDFQQKVKVDEYLRGADIKVCDKNSQASLSKYIYMEGFYNQYLCHIFGTIKSDFCVSQNKENNQTIVDDITISDNQEIITTVLQDILNIPGDIHLIVDFDTVHIKELLLEIFGDRIKWVENAQTGFDFAPLSRPLGYSPHNEFSSVLYLASNDNLDYKISRNTPIIFDENNSATTNLFFMKPFNKIVMFCEKGKAYSLIFSGTKAILIDKTYANKNGNVHDIITTSKTQNEVIKRFKNILRNGYDHSIASNLTKFIAKRLGDQGQVISSLVNVNNANRIFITHDSVARDFAILIGVPNVIFTKSTSEGEYGYIVYKRLDLLSPESNEERRAIQERVRIQEEARQKMQTELLEYLNTKFQEQKNLIGDELLKFERQFRNNSNKDEQMNLFKQMLKNIIDSVYFLKTYGTLSLREKASKSLSGAPELLNFRREKENIDKMKRIWRNTDKLDNTPNIRGIVSRYICFEELKMIDSILINDGVLSDLFRLSLFRYYSLIEPENANGRRSPSMIFSINAQSLLLTIKSDLLTLNNEEKINQIFLRGQKLVGQEGGQVGGNRKRPFWKSVVEDNNFNIIDEHFHLLLYMVIESTSQLRNKIELFNITNLLDSIQDKSIIEIINKIVNIIDTNPDEMNLNDMSLSAVASASASAAAFIVPRSIDVFNNEPFVFPFQFNPKYCEQNILFSHNLEVPMNIDLPSAAAAAAAATSEKPTNFLDILANVLQNIDIYKKDEIQKNIQPLATFIREYFDELRTKTNKSIEECITIWEEIYSNFKNGLLDSQISPLISQGIKAQGSEPSSSFLPPRFLTATIAQGSEPSSSLLPEGFPTATIAQGSEPSSSFLPPRFLTATIAQGSEPSVPYTSKASASLLPSSALAGSKRRSSTNLGGIPGGDEPYTRNRATAGGRRKTRKTLRVKKAKSTNKLLKT